MATKYPRIASAWYAERGVNADIVSLHGNIELGPIVGMTDRIENPNGPADWIAVNPDIVADHAGDPFNTFDTTLELVWDLVELYHFIESPEWAEKVPSAVPVYLISGDQDPCGNYGEGLYHVANLLAESGNKVSVKAYSGYRHEIHNELELRDEVEEGLVDFVNETIG